MENDGGAIDTAKLLKIYVGDKYLAVNHVKRLIEAQLGDGLIDSKSEKCVASQQDVILPGCTRIGKSPGSPYAYFSFTDDASLDAGRSIVCSIRTKGKRWVDVVVEPGDLGYFARKTPDDGRKRTETTPQATEEPEEPGLGVSPWADIPYAQQLKRKRRHCLRVLRRIAAQVPAAATEAEPNCYSDVHVIPSVNLEGYRNRVDYSIGTRDGAPQPCVGFNAGAYKKGYRAVTGLSPCQITPGVLQKLAGDVELWLQRWWERHPLVLKGYDRETHQGFWRRLSMRITADGRVMMALQTMSREWLVEGTESSGLFGELQSDFSHVFSPLCASLQWQEFDGISNAAPTDLPYAVLHGPATIVDYVDGKGFQISPNSFFQVNTAAMELLVRRLHALPFIHANTVLLDICSGTGLIGLSLHDRVKRVIGVEMTASAVEDAWTNAGNMKAANVHYICDKVENCYERIQSAIYETTQGGDDSLGPTDVVAIVDPPRSGLHKDVVKWLRRLKLISKLVYISCEQSALVRDAGLLLKPPSIAYPGDPFRGTSSFAVDFFPHTPHVEQVFVMERQ